MKITFANAARENYLYWQQITKKCWEDEHKLIKEVQREPFSGIGEPEPLKHALAGFWSHRITDEHRLVYAAKH